MCATVYHLKWCPLGGDELLTYVTWLDFEDRLEKDFNFLKNFFYSYPELFPGLDVDHLRAVLALPDPSL